MRTIVLRLAALAGALLILGAIVIWSGLVPIAASSGHWKITAWLLHTVMRQSVKTRSMGIETPPLDDPALVRLGAGHFEIGCARCHGSPLAPPDPVSLGMTPHPPQLSNSVGEWKPRHLFWIVKHGIKYTGMPAWPSQERDDEVWAVVAFLLELPGMSQERYRELAFGEAGTGAPLADDSPGGAAREVCIRCHARDGAGDGSQAFPRLDIQPDEYLYAALRSYMDGQRESGVMETAVTGMDGAELADLARFFANAAPEPQARGAPPRAGPSLQPPSLGRRLATEGLPEQKIPACDGCHGEATGRADYPRLAGQYARYLTAQLTLFRSKETRGGTRFTPLMETFAHRLSDEQIGAVAAYYAGLGATGTDGRPQSQR